MKANKVTLIGIDDHKNDVYLYADDNELYITMNGESI